MDKLNLDTVNAVLDAIQFSVKPVRLKLDGAPVAVHLLMTGAVEISANAAIEAARSAVTGLASKTVGVQALPAIGIVRAEAGWAEIENLVTGGRLSE